MDESATTAAAHADAVRLVDEQDGAVLSAHPVHVGQRSEVAVGAEHRVGEDEGTLLGSLGECAAQEVDVGVRRHDDAGP